MSWQERIRTGIRELAPAEHSADGRRSVVRLDLNEAAFAPDADEVLELQRLIARLELNRYPEASGEALRERLAQRWGVRADEILLGNGSIEIVAIAMTAFGAPRGGRAARMLHPDPTFGQYAIMASAFGLEPLPVPLAADFTLDEGACAAAIDRERPALAFFASPNNPTGNAFPAGALERLARRMDSVFVVDEAYADFAGASVIPELSRTPGLFVMRSLSKIGLAGLRVGALIGERAAIAELDKVRMPYNVNAVSLAFACSLLDHPERLERRIGAVVRSRDTLARELALVDGVEVFPSQANFVLIRTPFDARRVFEGLLEHGVLVRVFPHAARLERCLRISAGTPLDNLRCMRALRETLGALAHDSDAVARAG